jgi:hypothetical protein
MTVVSVIGRAGRKVGGPLNPGARNPADRELLVKLAEETWIFRGELHDGVVGPIEWNMRRGCFGRPGFPAFVPLAELEAGVAEDLYATGDRLEVEG